MTADAVALGRVYFHHNAHERWTDRQLHFWFLAAPSFYDRDAVKRVLKEVADELGLRSYVTYELIGPYDLMIRLYLKPGREARDFAKTIKDRLGPPTQSGFFVEDVARHWVWAPSGSGGRGPVVDPLDDVLDQRFPRTELALLNDQDNGTVERMELVDRYADLGLVRTVVRGDGIKVVVTIGFDKEPEEQELSQARERLAKWLDKSKDRLHERSLYVGARGQRQQFIVMCRLLHRDFHRVHDWLIEPIGDAVNTVHARTTTYPVVSADFVCFAETMGLPEQQRPDITTLMRSHELTDFEVKGSLLAPLNPWLTDDKPLREEASWPLTSVLKGIVGLLNSGGGSMLIGALEERPFRDDPKALARLRQFPAVGEYHVLGLVDPTYTQFGWDTWDTKFNNLLQSKISPPPGVLVQRRQAELEGQPVCIVEIDEPREDAKYWLRDSKNTSTYYARVGTSVQPLHGPDIDKHREDVRQHRYVQRTRRNHG